MPASRSLAALTLAGLLLAVGCSGGSGGSSGSSASPSAKSAGGAGGARPAPALGALPVSHPTVWLCRPGMASNPCAGGLDATRVTGPDVTAGTVEPFSPAADPKIDCFYVYPTLSEAAATSAPLAPEPAAIAVTRAQAARFAGVCRLFVPVYRQLTLTALVTGGFGDAKAQAQAAADVDSAWHDYLNRDNQGRGVVLIGHSQGAFQLIRLIQAEVDRNPAERARLVSALLLGGNVLVPVGRDVGGAFTNVPACRRPEQTGCVVAYSSFAETPPPNSLFGRTTNASNVPPGTTGTGMQVLCVNPANLGTGPADLHPYLPTRTIGTHLTATPQQVLPDLPTGFVTFPGLRGECRTDDGASFLLISGSRSPLIDGATTQALGPTWGLHLLDVSDAYGDLVSLVGRQAAAWR